MDVTSTAGWRALALVLGALAGVASAQGHGGGGPPPVIPAEAQQACSGLQEGEACTVAFRGTAMSGTCRSGPQGSALSCAPSGPPPQR
jgi:hypothetical protein